MFMLLFFFERFFFSAHNKTPRVQRWHLDSQSRSNSQDTSSSFHLLLEYCDGGNLEEMEDHLGPRWSSTWQFGYVVNNNHG